MLKLSGTNKKTGRTLLLLGLEEMNVNRLRSGNPIHFHCDDIGLPGVEIVIVLGKDLKELEEKYTPLIGPETVVRDQRREKKQ